LTTLDGEVVVVGYGEVKIVIEDRKRRLIHAQNLLELVEHDLETDDHAPRGAHQLRWSDIPDAKKILGEF
jgi:hypothetical protein